MPESFIFTLLIVLAISALVASSSYNYWQASVQLFEWPWDDVAEECENFLGPKGFTAVQVSPPQEHISGDEWWTRYQPVSYNIISRSGNQTQFEDMISRCSAAGVRVVVDAVINHMAAGSGTGIGGTTFGSRAYTGLYSANDFHHYDGNTASNCAVTDYTNKYNVQYCDLSGLPDLMTSSSYVKSTLAAYLVKLQSMGATGIRIDAAKHQDADELAAVLDAANLPDDFYVGQEVIGATGEAVQPYMYYDLGQVTEFYYSDYLCTNIVTDGKMQYLQTFGESWGLMPDKYAAVFIDNHDTQRNGRAQLTYKNGALYTLANMFMLAWPYGNVRVMSSYYFTDTDQGPPSVGPSSGTYCMDGSHWVCEHRWGPIANMVKWRSTVGTSDVSNWQQGSSDQIAFSRGGLGFIALNRGSSSWTATLQTGMSAGTYCNIIGDTDADDTDTCTGITVSSSGTATITVPSQYAVAFHANAMKKVQ